MKKRFAALAVAALIVFTFLFAQGPVQKVRLWDTNLSHSLLLKWNEDRAAGYTLNWIGITADRTITLQGNPTLDDWFDQDYHIIATPTFAGLYLESSTAAPFLKMTNESDTERDPIIQFSVGATPVIKWTMGVDDSDDDRWKLVVGDEFGSDHDTIVVTSGDGIGPPVAEWTLIDSYPTPLGAGSVEDPWGVCSDGTYVYYSEAGSDGVENIYRLVKIDPIAETEVCRSAAEGQGGPPWWNGFMFRQCATDGTYVYVGLVDPGTIRKYLCSDLTYDSSTEWLGQYDFTMCYWDGYLYVSGAYTYAASYVFKIRCSDMAVIWTRTFLVGSGVGEMNYAQGIATDGTNLCIGDFSAGGNNRLIRLDMDGAWVDATVVANTMGLTNKALWYAGNYLYNYATYTGVDKIEKRNKADLSIAETFLSLTASMAIQGCQSGDYHYIAERNDNRISKYQYTSGGATIPAGIQFRLKDADDVFHDIAILTPEIRLGVGTTSPTETIEAVGNIKTTGGQFISTIATGTMPVAVNSTTLSPNLNAGLVDGYHHDQSLLTTASPTHPTINLSATSNQIVLQSAGVTGTITATPTISNKTWTLQDFTGTIYQTDGTDVAVADGGTAKSAWTLYAIPYASGITTIGEIAIGAAGQVLAVNGGANGYTWIAPGGALALDDLTDVVITAAALGDLLRFDGSNWVDYPDINFEPALGNPDVDGKVLSSTVVGVRSWIAPGGAMAIDDLTDVNAPAPDDDDILRFDTASGDWMNEPLPAAANHDLLSATHSDTTAASAVAGDILYGDATPKWTKRAKGTDGQVLTLVSGLPNWVAPAGGGTHSLWFADAFPGSPTSQSDHFDNASLDVKWTAWQAGGGLSVSEADHFLKYTHTGDNAYTFKGHFQALPSGNFTITVKVDIIFPLVTYLGAGIALFEDATNNPNTCDIVAWMAETQSGTFYTRVTQLTDYQTWGGNPSDYVQGVNHPPYLRIRRNGTTLYFDYGLDGVHWINQYSMAQPFAPAEMGLIIWNYTPSTTGYALYDWFYYHGADVLVSPVGAKISI